MGLQLLEAIASGLPIIASDWSAHTDYLDQSNSYPVSSYLKIIDDPNYIVKCPQALNSKWCQVYIEDLQMAMRHVMDNYGEAQSKARIALDWVRHQTWQKAAISFVSEVVNMYRPVSQKSKKEEEKVLV